MRQALIIRRQRRRRLVFQLKLSVATFALLCALESQEVKAAVPTYPPYSCTFIYPDSYNCCWMVSGSLECHVMVPKATPAPAATAAPAATPDPTPGATPAPTAAPAPTPMSTLCPTDITETSAAANFNGGLTLQVVGTGILAMPNSMPKMECGGAPCLAGQLGPVSINCVMTGYDPPPLIRPDVVINPNWGVSSISPFVKLPSAGTSHDIEEGNTSTLEAPCFVPNSISNDDKVTVSPNNDPSVNSPIICPVAPIKNAPANVITPAYP